MIRKPNRRQLAAAVIAATDAAKDCATDPDRLLRRATGWRSVATLVRREAASGYWPSCRMADPAGCVVAAAFDAAMVSLADPRRALRWAL